MKKIHANDKDGFVVLHGDFDKMVCIRIGEIHVIEEDGGKVLMKATSEENVCESINGIGYARFTCTRVTLASGDQYAVIETPKEISALLRLA